MDFIKPCIQHCVKTGEEIEEKFKLQSLSLIPNFQFYLNAKGIQRENAFGQVAAL